MYPHNPQPQRPKHNVIGITAAIIAVVAVMLVVAVSCGVALSGGSDSSTPPAPGQHRAKAGTGTPTPSASTPSDSPYGKPHRADFHLKAKILSKQCFGSAGCNLTYRIKVSYVGAPIDPDKTYEVTYRVSGDESGTQTNTFTITGDQAEVQQEEIASTSSSAVVLKVHATSVERIS